MGKGISAEQLLALAKQPSFQKKFSIPKDQLNKIVAILYARELGELRSGTVVSIERMAKEAAALGQKLEEYPTVFRFDSRAPNQIAQNGFQPNPSKPFKTLWEHVTPESDSGSYVSTTLDPDNHIADKLHDGKS